jgi:hypothetical protein
LIAKRANTVRIRISESVTPWFVMIFSAGTCPAVDAPFTAFGVVFACSTKALIDADAAGVCTGGA